MSAKEWRRIASASDLAEHKPISVKVEENAIRDDEEILLVRLDGRVYATENGCSHLGCPVAAGTLEGAVCTCPCHNARFDLRSGRALAAPALDDLSVYDVKEDDGSVYVGAPRREELRGSSGRDSRIYAIVGGGAAGNAAAETLLREGFDGKIVMITPEATVPYDRTFLSKAFLSSAKMKTSSLRLRDDAFYESRNVEVRKNTSVISLDPARRAMKLSDGSELAADAVLLASGSRPRALDVPGNELPGVHLLRSLTDGERLKDAASNAKRAVLVGASFIATEVADSLRKRGIEVHIVAPEAVPFSRVFGERIGRRMMSMHEERGTVFHLGIGLSRITGTDRARAVELTDGSKIECDLVVAGVGAAPVVDYLGGSGLVSDGAVPVGADLQTSARGIFAAGDIAAVPDPYSGGKFRVEHWIVAERQGQHAARAMLESGEPYRLAPFFWTRQMDTSLKYVGHAAGTADAVYVGDVESGEFLAGFFEGERLAAVSGIGMGAPVNHIAARMERGGAIGRSEFDSLARGN